MAKRALPKLSPAEFEIMEVVWGLGEATIATIMEARFLLLLASGTSKARAVEQMIEGPLTAQCPASILQMHPHAFVIVDEAAAVRLAHPYETVEEVLSDPYEEYFWEGA